MASQTIAERIEKLLASTPPPEAEDVRQLASRLHSNRDHWAQALMRHAYTLTAIWLVSVGIGVGLVSEGEVGSFKVSAVKSLLVVVPAFVGLQSYLIAVALVSWWMLSDALDAFYKVRLPALYDLDLERLTDSPGLLGVEDFFEQKLNQGGTVLKRSNAIGGLAVAFFLIFGGTGMLVHVSYLAVADSGMPLYLSVGSICIGAISAVRGLLLALNANAITRW